MMRQEVLVELFDRASFGDISAVKSFGLSMHTRNFIQFGRSTPRRKYFALFLSRIAQLIFKYLFPHSIQHDRAAYKIKQSNPNHNNRFDVMILISLVCCIHRLRHTIPPEWKN